MDTLHSVIVIGTERSLPVTVALAADAAIATRGHIKQAVAAIAGNEISMRVGAIMNYSYVAQIHNLDIDVPSTALSSPDEFPGVRIF